MKDQHEKIKGYRDLTQEEIELMNEIKQEGEFLKSLVEKLQAVPEFDQRFIAIGKTDLQVGIMALVRSVARPESF